MARSEGELEVWCAGEEWCPVTSTATIIGRKWNPVIVHRLLRLGPVGFSELQRAISGISNKSLSESLETLEDEYGLIERRVVSDRPFRVEYSLSERGQSLAPVIDSMESWGMANLRPPKATDPLQSTEQD